MVINPIPLIRASQINPFVSFLKGNGAPVERLMRQARLPVSAIEEPDLLISYYSLCKFVETAALSQGIPDLGLLTSRESSVKDIGSFGELLVSSPTLYVALQRLCNMVTTHSNESRIWLTRKEGSIWLCREGIKSIPIGQLHDEYYSLIFMVNLVRLATGSDWWPEKIMLQTDKKVPEILIQDAATETAYIQRQVVTAVHIPDSLTALPLKHIHMCDAEDYSRSLMRGKPDDMPESFERSLQLALAPYLREYHPDIQMAAEITGLSVRTLQRRLNGCGQTYRGLVDKIRLQEAMRMIEDDSIKLIEISKHTGYSDSASFTRAFYRWTGISPRKYRLQHLANK